MPPKPRPQWQQATALITLGAGSIATGISIVPKAAAELTTPASIPPVTLLALEHANAPAPGKDAMLRAATVHMARHFLRLAQTRSPAEMEAMIWQYASTDGANHGPSCGAFASLTLELGSHIAGVDNWVTGGTSYPWPVHSWVDGRVDPNPASPGVVSILQDAQNHGRWHALGDGYAPQPGDWVLFDAHVEVVTKYQGGVLHTIGGDSLPNLSVNAHEYAGPLDGQGVAGFVDNGVGMSQPQGGAAHTGGGGKNGARATARPGRTKAAPRMAAAAPSPPGGPSSPTGPASSAVPVSGGAAPGHRARGGAAPDGTPAVGAAHGGGARKGAASSAGPVRRAAAPAQQPEFAPRAIPAPRSRYMQESHALPARGALAAPSGERAPAAAGSARSAQAARAAASRQQNRSQKSKQTSAAAPASQAPDQPPQGAIGSKQTPGRAAQHGERSPHHAGHRRAMTAEVPATGLRPARPHHAKPGEAAIPGLFKGAHRHHAGNGAALAPYHRHDVPPSNAPMPGTASQQAFINEVANGAMATQEKYGVPASVTIAQAIDESGWGQSLLATNDHNLFGIKGTGPAGSDQQPTQEVINGQLVNLSASFQIYQSIAQSIDAHGRLLARSADYAGAMAQNKDPNAFAAALTGVYATDPSYGSKLIQLMHQYDLYRFDGAAARGHAPGTGGASAAAANHPARAARQNGAQHSGGGQRPAHTPPPPSPDPRRPSPGRDRKPNPHKPGPVGNPVPAQPAPIAEPVPGQPAPIANPVPMQPGPITGPHSAAHDQKPARGPKTGRSVAAHRAGTPGSGQAAGHAPGARHDAVTPPAAVLYPGRSARPAPLAHPARPTELARPANPTPSLHPGSASTPTQAQLPGFWQGPGTGPASGAGPGEGSMSADAAIPGVPHGVTPHAAWPPARRPIGRLRPAHPAGRPALPSSRAQQAGPAVPGTVAHGSGDAQPAAAPAAPPANSSPGPERTPHLILHTASAPTVSQPGSAMIPGLPHPRANASPGHSAAGTRHAPASPGNPAGTTQPAATHSRPAARSAGQTSAPGRGPAASSNQAAPGGAARPSTDPAPAARASASAHPGRSSAAPSPRAANPVPAPPSSAPAPGDPVPAPASPVPAAANPVPTAASTPAQSSADVPGLVRAAPAAARTVAAAATASVNRGPAGSGPTHSGSSRAPGRSPAGSHAPGATLTVYHAHMPPSVRQAFIATAKMPLVRGEQLYRDVAGHSGLRWEILAACDWMQCKARQGYSPVYGEKLGALNPDDTCYRTKSAALEQCGSDLVQLARSVYQLDISTSHELSVRDLANVFAAYRWGGLLRQHCTSAMDFPYSVAGLTADHTHMRWPNIDEPNAPDKPGSRFRPQFGAVPVVLSLNYQALM